MIEGVRQNLPFLKTDYMTGQDNTKDSFISSVKRSIIKHPTQLGFSKKRWGKLYNSFENTSERDEQVFIAGIWFFDFFETIRQKLLIFNDKVFDADKIRRSYVAFINRDYLVIDTALKEDMKSKKEKTIIAGEISEKKLSIGPDDYNVRVLAAVEAGVSAVRFPLSETFYGNKYSVKRKATELEFLRILKIRINLASLYNTISEFWGECLWNKWHIYSKDNVDLIVPPNSIDHSYRVISEHRCESLNLEFSYHTINL